MPAVNPELAAKLVAGGRVAFGIGFLAAPGALGSQWAGKVADKPAAQIFIRALGARDLALGLGVLASPRAGLRTWVMAGVIADACDAGATVAAREELESGQLAATLAIAGGSALAGVAIAAFLGGSD